MITIGALADALGAKAAGDLDLPVSGPAEPAAAGADHVAVAFEPRFAEALQQGRARAALLWEGADWQAFGLQAAIFIGRPRYAMAAMTRAFARKVELAPGIHATAVIDPSAEIGEGAAIGPFVVIGPRARIGDNAVILPHVSIGEEAQVGADALIHAGARIGARVRIGARFICQPGAVIGGDGFSFATPPPGRMAGETIDVQRIHSLGSVVIGDDCEVGANACIDRGTIADTTIGDGTKIDNHVQVGHNCRIGRHCLLCGHVAIGGSTVIGDRVVLAGKASLADHLTIGSNVVVTGSASVGSNVPDNRVLMGYPAIDMARSIEMYKALRRLPRFMARLDGTGERVPKHPRSE